MTCTVYRFLVLLAVTSSVFCRHFKLGMLSPRKHIRLGWDINAAAATMAVEKAAEVGILDGNQITILWRDDQCRAKPAAGKAVELHITDDVDAFIGPPCSAATCTAGALASYWNLPMFSQASTDPSLSNKKEFTTLVRIGPPFTKMGAAVTEIFKKFNWRRAVIISRRPVGSKFVFCDYAARSIEEQFRTNNVSVSDWMKISEGITDDQISEVLQRVRQRGRIVLLCASITDQNKIMLQAHARGMTGSEYAYLILHHLPPGYVTKPWSSGGDKAEVLKQAYRAAIQVSVASMTGDTIETFREMIPIKMAEPPWNYNGTLEEGKVGSDYAPFLYDIVYLYTLTLNRTLEQGEDPRNGSQMFKNSQAVTFNGITGQVVMDKNADREPNYWLWHLTVDGSSYEVWTEVRMINARGSRLKITKPARWHTSDNRPPPDTPRCGFLGELCPEDDTARDATIAACVSVGILLIIVAVSTVFYYRRHKMEEEMRAMLWKVNHEDLVYLTAGGKFSSLINRSSFRSLASVAYSAASKQTEGTSVVGAGGRDLASYKGTVVVVHKLDINRGLTMSKQDHVELHTVARVLPVCGTGGNRLAFGDIIGNPTNPGYFKMRQLSHENINPFMGACFDQPHGFILYTCCQKGALQDLLANDDIKLDWMFQCSLINDIVNGMAYLHHSPLRSHGNLTSNSCVIDNRWVLKISDYGLQEIRRTYMHKNDQVGNYQKYRDKLWTAPELLRLPVFPTSGTQSGDIYSFAMVMYEIMCRTLPFSEVDLEPKDIIARVCAEEDEPYRPKYSGKDGKNEGKAIELMMMCWAENPEDRPQFSQIRQTIREFNSGKRLNIIDNMLRLMERYANNLEELVDQRTEELNEEKKKTDLLLYRMLPQSVADRLKTGQPVDAEIFESVTIYFSDICGFTSLSSVSTPIQVVAMLNDLYTMCDGIIANHDVYKVETIGDAYMVVSGLPQRNGSRHAAEIANMALDLVHAVSTTFVIQHRPDERLRLRVGVHTGSCAAGVVGLAMPRYCLFGDTVNTASRMESNGEPLQIHISQETQSCLLPFGVYLTEKRGEVAMKGKGVQTTYWLNGKIEETFDT